MNRWSTMLCRVCNKEILEGSAFCNFCGKAQITKQQKAKRRGNGTGTAIKLGKDNWKAVAVLGYKSIEQNGKIKKLPVKKTKSGFKTKTEALSYIATLKRMSVSINLKKSLADIYKEWKPTHKKDHSTMNCYSAAYNWYKPLWYIPFHSIGIDDWQECIDECEKGRRTKENMRSLTSLLYTYAKPRGYVPPQLMTFQGKFLKINETDETRRKEGLSEEHLKIIQKHLIDVPYSDYIYCQCYLGYRPQEFLLLDMEHYNAKEHCFVGGSKTEAGLNRSVTVSPKIQPIVDRLTANKSSGFVFCDEHGNGIDIETYRELFYVALEKMGISNPIEANGQHKYTPHSCRHTFATLMKRAPGTDKDKLALMGHTSDEMLRYYQDVNYADLRKVTDNL